MKGGTKVQWAYDNGSTSYGEVVGDYVNGFVMIMEHPQGPVHQLLIVHESDLVVLEQPAEEQPELEPEGVASAAAPVAEHDAPKIVEEQPLPTT